MNTSNLLAENPAQNQEPVNLETPEKQFEQTDTGSEDIAETNNATGETAKTDQE